jgi:hypothetical protein
LDGDAWQACLLERWLDGNTERMSKTTQLQECKPWLLLLLVLKYALLFTYIY